MELKKSNKANLEWKRGQFFEVGLLIALGVVFLAFEMQVASKTEKRTDDVVYGAFEEDFVPITRIEEPPPPPLPPPKVTDILEIVANEIFIDANIHIDIEVDLWKPLSFSDFSPKEMEDEPEEIFFISLVEDKPLFEGKDAETGFREWVNSKILYPPLAVDNGITGRVYTEFTIDRDGNITDINILRGADPLLNAEALRVLRMSPKWTPGMQRGKPVKVRYQFPFVFQLR